MECSASVFARGALSPLVQLPKEIFGEILSYLDGEDLLNCAQLCHSFQDAINVRTNNFQLLCEQKCWRRWKKEQSYREVYSAQMYNLNYRKRTGNLLCLDCKSHKVLARLRCEWRSTRLCKQCEAKFLINKGEAKRQYWLNDKDLMQAMLPVVMERNGWGGKTHLYLKLDIENLALVKYHGDLTTQREKSEKRKRKIAETRKIDEPLRSKRLKTMLAAEGFPFKLSKSKSSKQQQQDKKQKKKKEKKKCETQNKKIDWADGYNQAVQDYIMQTRRFNDQQILDLLRSYHSHYTRD